MPETMNISVVIPVRNEQQSIATLLEGLLSQTLKPAEILITDGGSTDATPEIIAAYFNRVIPIRLFREAAALPGRGRNIGAKHAANEWLAFIDAGITPERNWLELLAARTNSQPNAEVVYGSYEPLSDSLFQRCSAIAYLPPPLAIDGKLVRSRFVASSLMKRAVWEAVGGFPENLRSAEDILFMNKIERAGHCITYAPEALVRWQLQKNPWRAFKRFVTYARNNMRAGLWHDWQEAILKRYALLAVSALPAFTFGVRWLWVTLLFWLAMLVARAAVAIWRNRVCYPGGLLELAARLLVLVPLISMLDAATFIGTLQWAVRDKAGL